jgi:methionine sulfoxide reductase heme-binding subunit
MATVNQRWALAPWRERSGEFSWLRAATFAAMLVPAASMVYDWRVGNFGPLPLIGLIYWSGVWATALLLAALAVRPLQGIFGWNRLVGVRRMIGVSAFAYSVLHLVVFFPLHRWDWPHILMEWRRSSLIVATVSLAGLLVLAATSFDAAVRWLGGRGWKQLHRANYALTFLAVAHYLLSPGIFLMQYVAAGVLFWVLAWRTLERRGADPLALSALGVGAAVFTAVLEAGWMWAYHGIDPREPLADNLSVAFGVPASWQVLAVGLTVAVAASARRSLKPAQI